MKLRTCFIIQSDTMPQARKHLISLEATSYYNCVSRCVRRAFLCGHDTYSDTSYEHRRQWVEDRILELGSVMCVEVLAYAVMSNHLHVVLRADAAEALSQTNDEVIARWHQLYLGTTESRKYAEGFPLDETESANLEESVATWRERLFDISWFMRALNEPIARQANLEDRCTGKFWAGFMLLQKPAFLPSMAVRKPVQESSTCGRRSHLIRYGLCGSKSS